MKYSSEGTNYYAASTSYSLTVEDPLFVDLGLPSGTKWAKWEFGASSIGGTGEKYDYYDWQTYNSNGYMSSRGYAMPTVTQAQELLNNCTITESFWNQNPYGVNGYFLTSKINGKQIFMTWSGSTHKAIVYDGNAQVHFYSYMGYGTITIDHSYYGSYACYPVKSN